jgi:hypothetical protein
MVAFSPDMKITKYATVGQILEGFYGPRLEAYELRRQQEMRRLKAEAEEADAKARFIRAVLEGSLDLRRATDEQILAGMQAHSLPGLSSGTGIDRYDYLLRLRMDRVKATAIQEAEAAVLVAKTAVAELETTTAGELWIKDLQECEAAWKKMQTVRAESLAPAAKGRTKPKSAAKV